MKFGKKMQDVIYRYLRLRGRRVGLVRGTTVCRHLGIPLPALRLFNDMEFVISLGPAIDAPKRYPVRYAKYNGYASSFRCTFRSGGRIWCFKDRPLRKWKWPPKIIRLHSPGATQQK